jgi:hypothetical protein
LSSFRIALLVMAALTSLTCTILLIREYLRKRIRLLLWCALCFVGLTINNIMLFMDLVVFPEVDLRLIRLLASLGGMLFLLYGFIWETDA